MNEAANTCEYNEGEHVMYKSERVCVIEAICKREFSGLGEREFYILKPVNDKKTSFYVPVDAPQLCDFISRIPSPEEVDEYIDRSNTATHPWIPDVKARALRYGEMMKQGDRADILWIARNLTQYKRQVEENKKKLYASDARMLADAERLITEEFSFALGLERDDVVPYIISKSN